MNKKILIILVFVLALSLFACSSDKTNSFTGSNGKWTITLSDKLEKGDVIEQEGMLKTSFGGSDGIDLIIIEMADPGYVADKARLEEETTLVDEIEPTRVEELNIENFGMVYGALVTDHQLASEMFYYMTNVDKDVIYFMFIVEEGQLTENKESIIKSMITSLVLK